ncbi:unnamed protein product [Malus baccata var. baccata]
MNIEAKSNMPEVRAYASNHKGVEEKSYKGKKDLKCSYCNVSGHSRDWCWILHPELKPKLLKDQKGPSKFSHNSPFKSNHSPFKANHANHAVSSSTEGVSSFISYPTALINKFAAFLHKKQGSSDYEGTIHHCDNNETTLLGKFAGFLAENERIPSRDISGPSHQEDDW